MSEIAAEATALRVFVDHCVVQQMEGKLDGITAAKANMLCTELQYKTVDECLKFFSGYGYMLEYPIAKAYIDSHMRTITGGSSEIMREIIGRDLFKDA